MPGKVKVKIISGKNLPVMDRSSDTTDAYVEIKLGNTTYKTDVCRRTLHPQWNTDWYRFEVDDSELQDEPLQIRLMDHDTYSANDAIGKVYLNLNPLLLPVAGQIAIGDNNLHHEISGWIPVYDTMHGIRGEVNVTVKVELFSDFNRFRQSSCGIQFFYSPTIPQGYQAKIINGFVEELIVDDDPEYQWIDKIRTPRASNEARQTLFFKLSGELQRKIGVKAINLGGNAVIGYRQCFDLEGESGIVARGIGTAVTLFKSHNLHHVVVESKEEEGERYLKFVGDGKSFRLCSSSSTHKLIPIYPNLSQLSSFEPSLKTRESKTLSTRLYSSLDSLSPLLPSSAISEEGNTSIKTLLNQEDNRGESAISRRFQRFKHSQKSLSKKMTALKAKLGDSIGEETDEERHSEGSEKRKFFKRTSSDSSFMAEVLARSVMQATNSLSCILEVQGYPKEEATMEKVEPVAGLLNNTKSQANILDDNVSDAQSYSSSDSSSSGSEYEYRDYRRPNNDVETISNIISNVEKLQRCLSKEKLQKQRSMPSILTRDYSVGASLVKLGATEGKNCTGDIKYAREESNEAGNKDISKSTILEPLKVEPSAHFSRHADLSNTKETEIYLKESLLSSSYPKIDQPEDVKGIAPANFEHVTIKPKHMVKTAMQTMLLEKINIMGTYTPPTSPNVASEESRSERKNSFLFSEVKMSNIPKSFSSASFEDHRNTHVETVLGMPFTSLSSLKSENENAKIKDVVSYFSDSILHQPIIQSLNEMDNIRKRRFNLLHLKSGRSGVFNKIFGHGSKKELSEDKEQHQNILSRMFHARHEDKSIKDEETQTSNEVLDTMPLPSPSPSNQNLNNTSKTHIQPPCNTEIDLGALSITKIACVTSNRHQTSPPIQESNGTGHKEEVQENVRMTHSPVKITNMAALHRRSSDSDLSVTPKGNSLTGSDRSVGNTAAYFMRNNHVRRGQLIQDNFEMLEYPFLTMTKFSPRFIVQIGGSISARSVKLLERISNVEEPESRDIWWSEIRMEIRSHARTLNCNAVLGYIESTSICDDVCVLSACGTAAVIDFHSSVGDDDNFNHVQLTQRNVERDKNLNGHHKTNHDSPEHVGHPSCRIIHLPYDEKSVPVKSKVSKCPTCQKGKVPEVIIATIEPTENIPSVGKGCFIESHVTRPLKDLRGETIAKEISDGLPFLEYELHRLLVNKLKIKGMNAIFSLKIRITVGEKMLIGIATGTAMYLSSLPSPELPMLVTDRVSDEKIVADLQERLNETFKKNREIYHIKDDNQNTKCVSDEDSEEEQPSLDISSGNKDCCILEMDDPEDAEVLHLLMEEKVPDGFHVVNTESVPGLEDLEIVKNLQMFTQIYRAKLTPPYNLQKHFVRLLQSVYFKLRRMVPCALCDLQFRVDLPEPDEIQLCVIGMALGLGKKMKNPKPAILPKKPEEDLIFKLDEEPTQDLLSGLITKSNPSSLKYRQHRSPSKYRSQSIPHRERHGVDITPLSYVPGGYIEQYLGNLNFFFIRETTSIREEGGLSGFIHSFITEVLAMVRSHVTALGGNALVAFFLTECVLNHNLHKNQGQCLINVGGDVVSVSYYKDDMQ